MPYSVENKLLRVAVKKMLHSGVARSYHSFKIDFFPTLILSQMNASLNKSSTQPGVYHVI